ncbi:type IV pilus biogenesis protein PilM [Caldibacillus debilis]|jgi:type IV pilus assembly protein PilM|uniref:Tfp pilus assembly protein, ATPase PilM n=1 Tax=Caldibacillus debilis GB1 TaxID=1339248 RepID=A0A420VC46_9BACI|nr:pilus assembly protein PilM [Caldibacillus debilis]RKO61106.1 Tfp pilus assembly protein, ATPase PilM [Caldibacillus debilis GB1]
MILKKKTVNLIVDDYAIRCAEQRGSGLEEITLMEKPVPEGMVEQGRIADEIAFYEFFKGTVQEWGIKRRKVRFCVPDSLVSMKKETVPEHVKENELKAYFHMEIGNSIYLPFENPAFDVCLLPERDANDGKRKALLFSVPLEELNKYSEIFIDAGLKPVQCDIRSLSAYRYFAAVEGAKPGKVYLFLEVNLNWLGITIFSDDLPEFMRYQDLDIPLKNWRCVPAGENAFTWEYAGDETYLSGLLEDQMVELERIMNFYRYSIHKGRRTVTGIILYGDYPDLAKVRERIEENFTLPVTILNGYAFPEKIAALPRSFIPVLGLALKGESS